ncbi:MAG: hypothetical protein V3T23_01735 [Nitrososphaerales archaeon]
MSRANLDKLEALITTKLDEFSSCTYEEQTYLSMIIMNLAGAVSHLECAMEESEGEDWKSP